MHAIVCTELLLSSCPNLQERNRSSFKMCGWGEGGGGRGGGGYKEREIENVKDK